MSLNSSQAQLRSKRLEARQNQREKTGRLKLRRTLGRDGDLRHSIFPVLVSFKVSPVVLITQVNTVCHDRPWQETAM
eukprot:5904033-Amphidinium_carterae.1